MAAAATAERRRGRPARLSREAIVEAALALLERAPHDPLTIARIAAEVDAVPAALYRHFASLDELLDGVLGRVLGDVELAIRRRAPWPEQIRDWMTSLRDHLLRYPAVLPLIGRRGRTSPAWLDAARVQIEILERVRSARCGAGACASVDPRDHGGRRDAGGVALAAGADRGARASRCRRCPTRVARGSRRS